MCALSIEEALREHADCTPNDSRSGQWIDGSADTGVDVWSCGITVPFIEDYDEMHRAHVADAIRAHLAEHTDEAAGAVERVRALADEWDGTVYKLPPGYPMTVNAFVTHWFKQPLRAALAGGVSGAAEGAGG